MTSVHPRLARILPVTGIYHFERQAYSPGKSSHCYRGTTLCSGWKYVCNYHPWKLLMLSEAIQLTLVPVSYHSTSNI